MHSATSCAKVSRSMADPQVVPGCLLSTTMCRRGLWVPSAPSWAVHTLLDPASCQGGTGSWHLGCRDANPVVTGAKGHFPHPVPSKASALSWSCDPSLVSLVVVTGTALS